MSKPDWQVWYEDAFELHAEAEQLAAMKGDMASSKQHHDAARLLAWSLTAEIDDKEPTQGNRRDVCACKRCTFAQYRRVT